MKNMQDRVYDRRRRIGIRDDDLSDSDLNARLEREIVREDEQAVIQRDYVDERRSDVTGY